MPDASFRARYRLAGAAFESALVRFGTLTLKYADDQPRVPAGSPDGGQWTSGGVAISTPGEMFQELSLWTALGDFSRALVFQVAAADLPKLTGSILEWLGPGAIQLNSPNGAVQFMSADRVKQIRFDITPETSHGLKPHINVEPGGRHIWVKRHV